MFLHNMDAHTSHRGGSYFNYLWFLHYMVHATLLPYLMFSPYLCDSLPYICEALTLSMRRNYSITINLMFLPYLCDSLTLSIRRSYRIYVTLYSYLGQ